MKSIKILSAVLAGSILFGVCSMPSYAATKNQKVLQSSSLIKTQSKADYMTETLTAQSDYVSNDTRVISGYAKDEQGNPLANRTIIVFYCKNFYSLPSNNTKIFIEDDKKYGSHYYYSTLTTDSNGYYSFDVHMQGYYQMYLTYSPIEYFDLTSIINGYEQWPCNWIVFGGDNYYGSDVRATAYSLQ